MKSLRRVATRSISLPISADEILEFHAARLLLLVKVCGVSSRIDGLTKMAKLDFFARYPDFFELARSANDRKSTSVSIQRRDPNSIVESAMVRHHYGPWDKRYYHILAFLESRGLIVVSKNGSAYTISLTDLGQAHAVTLSRRESFLPLVGRMRDIKKAFGAKTGTFLKNLIYRLFDEEVASRSMGEVIES